MNYLLFTIIFDLRICISFFAKQSEWEFGSGVEGSQVEKNGHRQNKTKGVEQESTRLQADRPCPCLRCARLVCAEEEQRNRLAMRVVPTAIGRPLQRRHFRRKRHLLVSAGFHFGTHGIYVRL